MDQPPLTPRSRRQHTATSLLNLFLEGARKSLPRPTADKMPAGSNELGHGPRQKRKISYVNLAESDDDDAGPSEVSSAVTAPKALPKLYKMESDEKPALVSERTTSAGCTLRPRCTLSTTAKASEIIRKAPKRPRLVQGSRSLSSATGVAASGKSDGQLLTSRQAIRHTIATETGARRARFLVAKRDYFLPLLPRVNFVQKLLEKAETDKDLAGEISDYVEIQSQPEGVKATMKPYQLAGLSFLLYLHHNGLSGILGDEMGLGKTLQTLSLVQYLKEHPSRKASEEVRPFLVICPLSVLSSWMAEIRRWTPGLRAVRLHGPPSERTRVKRVIEGLEDRYGNQLKKRPQKKQSRTKVGKSVISLDSDTDEANGAVDIVVTTYETYQSEQGWFKRIFAWQYVVLDEGHKIKNDLSLISTSLQGLRAEFRLILTGTPLQNNLAELWALLHWLYPEVFTDKTSELFRDAFDLTRGKISTSFMDNARRLLELIMLRRMKSSPSVNINLPPKTEVLLFVPLTPMQRFWYRRLLTRTDRGLLEELFQDARGKELKVLKAEKEEDSLTAPDLNNLELLEGVNPANEDAWEEHREIVKKAIVQESQQGPKSSAWTKLMNLVMQLRKCCNHPYLLPNSEPDPYFPGEHVIRASGKFILLDKLISELVIRLGEKVLFFSGFTTMLDLCEELLNLRGGDGTAFKYMRLDGSTGRARRNLGIRLFNSKPEYKVMLISTRAGGLGINLATATTVVMIDRDWNPQVDLQAEARAHRLGQTKPVTVYKLCTQGTVEEQMMRRIQKKLYLSAKVTEAIRDIHSNTDPKSKKKGGRVKSEDDMPSLGTGELLSLVRRGAQTLAKEEIDVKEMLSWDWEKMLDQCKDMSVGAPTAEQKEQSPESRQEEEQQWLSQMEKVESFVFDGKRYARDKERKGQGLFAADMCKADRRIGKNTTVMVNGFAINKESMQCEDWVAVPTFAGKDPRLAEPKRAKKAAVVNQDHCQICWNGGEIICCSGCPRAYHSSCLDSEHRARSKSAVYYCSQHECFDCGEKTSNAGGMLYRCRWCERGYCEDCLDWDKTELIGDELPEYELLGFHAVTQAYYIVCPSCKEQYDADPGTREFCDQMIREYDEAVRAMSMEAEAQVARAGAVDVDSSFTTKERTSQTGSLTNVTTRDVSEVATPVIKPEGWDAAFGVQEAKALPRARWD